MMWDGRLYLYAGVNIVHCQCNARQTWTVCPQKAPWKAAVPHESKMQGDSQK